MAKKFGVALCMALIFTIGLGLNSAPSLAKSNKVTICHNEAHNAHTIEVDDHAVKAHLAHGDHLGACQDTTTTTTPPTTTTITEPPTTTTTVTPSGPRCQPGWGPYGGKDGDESDPYHNDECCPDFNTNQQCDDQEAMWVELHAVNFLRFRNPYLFIHAR